MQLTVVWPLIEYHKFQRMSKTRNDDYLMCLLWLLPQKRNKENKEQYPRKRDRSNTVYMTLIQHPRRGEKYQERINTMVLSGYPSRQCIWKTIIQFSATQFLWAVHAPHSNSFRFLFERCYFKFKFCVLYNVFYIANYWGKLQHFLSFQYCYE